MTISRRQSLHSHIRLGGSFCGKMSHSILPYRAAVPCSELMILQYTPPSRRRCPSNEHWNSIWAKLRLFFWCLSFSHLNTDISISICSYIRGGGRLYSSEFYGTCVKIWSGSIGRRKSLKALSLDGTLQQIFCHFDERTDTKKVASRVVCRQEAIDRHAVCLVYTARGRILRQ